MNGKRSFNAKIAILDFRQRVNKKHTTSALCGAILGQKMFRVGDFWLETRRVSWN